MYLEQIPLLRQYLGEVIEAGADDDSSMFADSELEDILTRMNGDVHRAAEEGWRMKAANYTDLVDVTEGNASRAMSQLLKNATAMMTYYGKVASSATGGRTRIGRIRRRPY